MILGIVRGTVVATQRADGVSGAKYLLIEKCDQHGAGKNGFHVALDLIGAGPGEMVMMSQGSPNRQTQRTYDKPIDAAVLAIVDMIDQNDTVVYRK